MRHVHAQIRNRFGSNPLRQPAHDQRVQRQLLRSLIGECDHHELFGGRPFFGDEINASLNEVNVLPDPGPATINRDHQLR